MSLFDNPPLHDFPDRALRQALAHPGNLRDLLVAALPGLAPHLDFSQVEEVPRDFLLEDWRGREADLFFRLPYQPAGEGVEQIVVCVLLEHQSQPDPRLPLRLLLHALLFWEQQWKEWERRHPLGEPLRLTPVIPVVFHTGARPWGSNRSLAELIGGPEEIQRLAPAWPVAFWDLAEHDPEELLAADGPFLNLLSMVRVEDDEAERFQEVFGRLMAGLGPLAQRDKMRWRDLLWLALSWVLQRRDKGEREPLLELAQSAQAEQKLKEEVSEMTQKTRNSWADELKEEYQKAGEKIGEKRGRERAAQTARKAIRALLKNRFGPVPEEVGRQLDECLDLERLEAALERAETISSLEGFQL